MRLQNAIIYTRISSQGQQEWAWLSSQRKSCEEFCKREWYKVVEYFEDVYTGWDIDRPWIKKLFKFIDDYNKKHPEEKVDVFVADNIDRIARNVQVHIEITTELRKRGVIYKLVSTPLEDTPQWQFMEVIMAGYSQLFRAENTKRTISRQEARLRDWYRSYNPPKGYIMVKAKWWWKIMKIQEPEATIVKEALEWYANGILNSVNDVSHFLWRKGLRTKTWNPPHSLAWRMLNNILYAGYIEFNKVARNKKTKEITHHRQVPLTKGKHEALISLETYYKIQEKLWNKRQRPSDQPIKKVHDDFPLRGFLVCSCCELNLTGGKSRSKSKKQIPYYQFNKKCKYSGKSVRADMLHEEMEKIISSVKADDRFLNYMKEIIEEEKSIKDGDTIILQKNISKEIQKLDKEQSNLVDTLSNSTSTIVQDKITQKIEELEVKKSSLQSQLYSLEKETEISSILDIAFKVLSEPYAIREGGSVDEKQMLLRLLFSKKIPIDFSTRIYWTLPFSNLYQLSKDFNESNLSKSEGMGFEPTLHRV